MAAELEFVAFSVAAEIVMVVENEDAGGRALRAIEMGCGESTDAAANDHQIVGIFARLRGRRGFPEVAVAQAVGHFEGARVAAAQAGEGGRVVAGRVLRCGVCRGCGG